MDSVANRLFWMARLATETSAPIDLEAVAAILPVELLFVIIAMSPFSRRLQFAMVSKACFAVSRYGVYYTQCCLPGDLNNNNDTQCAGFGRRSPSSTLALLGCSPASQGAPAC